MSIEANKALAARFYRDVIDPERYDLLGEIVAEDVIIHDPLAGELQGREALDGLIKFFHAAFHWTETLLDRMIAEGDLVALMHRHPVTHHGDFMGAAPTGRSFTVPGTEIFRIADGKIAEFWRFDADGYLFMQVGLVPAPAAA
jgi:predicted SnoaL-like aldol condensation-catalyzing enzyme